nr:uncharacterized protein LOC127323471 [Lolium perenne]
MQCGNPDVEEIEQGSEAWPWCAGGSGAKVERRSRAGKVSSCGGGQGARAIAGVELGAGGSASRDLGRKARWGQGGWCGAEAGGGGAVAWPLRAGGAAPARGGRARRRRARGVGSARASVLVLQPSGSDAVACEMRAREWARQAARGCLLASGSRELVAAGSVAS